MQGWRRGPRRNHFSGGEKIEYRSGWGGIRTPGTVSRTAVFKTAALDHSATHPMSFAKCFQSWRRSMVRSLAQPRRAANRSSARAAAARRQWKEWRLAVILPARGRFRARRRLAGDTHTTRRERPMSHRVARSLACFRRVLAALIGAAEGRREKPGEAVMKKAVFEAPLAGLCGILTKEAAVRRRRFKRTRVRLCLR